MLMERVVGAFTFKKEVYADVENDPSFTKTAWIIVTVVAFLTQTQYIVNRETLIKGIMAWVLMSLFTIGGFAVAAYLISAVGQALFNAETDFNEMVRVLGLAYVWSVVSVLGLFGSMNIALWCLTALPRLAGWGMSLVSWIFAVNEALDLEIGETIITVIIGWVATFIVIGISWVILGPLGLATGFGG